MTQFDWKPTKTIALPRNPWGGPPDPVADALSWACKPWALQALARLLRDAGEVDVPTRAEAEYAAALHWMVGLALEHGDRWTHELEQRMGSLIEVVRAKSGAPAT